MDPTVPRRRGRFWRDGHVLGVAHRGASWYAPENTLVAFRLALEHGAPAVECDIQRTRDGHLVVIHDQIVDRTTDGRGAVGDYYLEGLRQLDAGRWFSPEFAGERVPLLDEVLGLVRGHTLLALEIKNSPVFYEGIEQQVVNAVRSRGMEEDVLLISFDHKILRNVRAFAPELATGILYAARLADAPGAARAAYADALCVEWGFLTEDVMAQAREANLGVVVWTVDDERILRRCQALGVDGMISNDTKLLQRLLRG